MAKHRLPTIENTIESVLKGGKGYPDVNWLADYRGITPQEAYDSIVKHQGETNWGALAMEKPKLPEAPPALSHKPKIPYANKTNAQHLHDLPKGILRGIFGILSIMAGIRSWGFIYGWFSQWDSGFFSVLMAFILTGIIIALPQAAIIFKREKRYFMLAVSSFLIIIAVTFSMVATVAGLYNDRSKSLHEASLASAANKGTMAEIERLEEQGKQTASDKLLDSNELTTLQSKLKEYEPATLEYNRVVNRVDNLKKRIDGYNNTIRMIQERIENKATEKVYVIERDDFFTYLEGVTGVKKAESEFSVSVVISIIIDIAGPVLASIALFL